jgi:hypothetical protein
MKKSVMFILLLMSIFIIINMTQTVPLKADQPAGCWKCYKEVYYAYCNAPEDNGHFKCSQSVPWDCDLFAPGCGGF